MTRTNPKAAVRDEYDALSREYDARWGYYTSRSVQETIRRTPVRAADRVLDVGCGTGQLLRELQQTQPSIRPVGVDLSIGMAFHASEWVKDVVAGDAEFLPFDQESFDLIVSSSSFHFWPHRNRALGELWRVLRPSGRLVITDWCDNFVACRVCDAYLRWRDPGHQPILGESECVALLEKSRFAVVGVERYKISWLWGLMTTVAEKRAA